MKATEGKKIIEEILELIHVHVGLKFPVTKKEKLAEALGSLGGSGGGDGVDQEARAAIEKLAADNKALTERAEKVDAMLAGIEKLLEGNAKAVEEETANNKTGKQPEKKADDKAGK